MVLDDIDSEEDFEEEEAVGSSRQPEKAKRSVENLFKESQDAVRKYVQDRDKGKDSLVRVLEASLALFQHADGKPNATRNLNRHLNEAGIKATGRTTNRLTPVVKLVFGEEDRSNLSRYAGALAYAHISGVKSHELREFLRKKHGIVECARLYTASRNSKESTRAAEQREKHAEALRSSAISVEAKAFTDAIGAGLHAALIEKGRGGKVRVLGIREEKADAVKKYAPIQPISPKPLIVIHPAAGAAKSSASPPG